MRTPTSLLAICCFALALPVSTLAGEDQGRARYVPWSGYWWPIRKAGMLGPLRKYDLITGRQAAPWEARAKPPGGAGAWWGYCHAWSAASILEREPRDYRSIRTFSGGMVTLNVGDQKGLLTVAHDADNAHIYGRRFLGRGREDYQDIYPDVLWKYLRLHVKQQGVPLVLDTAAGSQVWNYPVYAYQVRYTPLGDGRQLARMKILMADDAVHPSFVGTKVKAKTYLFTFRMQGGAVVMGSGRWAGVSVKDHPDFAWYPTLVRARNPHVKYSAIKAMVSTGRSRDPDEPLPAELAAIEAGTAIPVSAVELASLLAYPEAAPFKLEASLVPVNQETPVVGGLYYLRGTSEKDGYLYLFHVTAENEVRLIYPMTGQDNRVLKGKEFELGGPGSAARWNYPSKAGTFRVAAVVTPRPLLLGRLDPDDLEGDAAEPGRGFRWEPSEREIVQQLLKEFLARKLTLPRLEEETGINVKELVKEFAVHRAEIDVKAR